MARRRGRYKMTPRRRAALRKAQMASARKRKGQGLKNFGKAAAAVAGTVALSGAIWHLEDAVRHPGRKLDDLKSGHAWLSNKLGKGIDPNTPGRSLAGPIRYFGPPGSVRRIRTNVGGRRISSRQRSRLG